jgi:hypothetical protein
MERPAAAIGLVILLMCSLPAAGGGTVAAADGQMKTVRIFGEEGCINKDDFSALKRLGDAFQRDLKPVLRLDILVAASWSLRMIGFCVPSGRVGAGWLALLPKRDLSLSEASHQRG